MKNTFQLVLIVILIFTPNINSYQSLMLINFIRHGNRTPGKIHEEIKEYFQKMDTKKLTLNGFQQMNILGKYYRKKYIDTGIIKLNMDKITHEFLLISSPSPRSIESSIAYSMGLFPEKMYKLYDFNQPEKFKNEVNPPIMENLKFKDFDMFNIVIEKSKNTLFHSKNCKNKVDFNHIKKEFINLNTDEKELVHKFLRVHFPNTLKDKHINNFSDKLARNIYTSMRIVNKHYRKKYFVPDNLEIILKRVTSNYGFYMKIVNDEMAKIRASSFFDHLLKLFDNKIKNFFIDKNKNNWDKIYEQFLDNFKNYLPENLFSVNNIKINPLSDFLPDIENEDYSDLKFVTYSGHEGNLTGIVRNFLDEKQLKEYFEDFEKYYKILFISFAATIDFKLIYDDTEEFYVKIFLNGEEVFEKIRSHTEGEYLNYDKNLGIKYEEFRKFLNSRIHDDLNKCEVIYKK